MSELRSYLQTLWPQRKSTAGPTAEYLRCKLSLNLMIMVICMRYDSRYTHIREYLKYGLAFRSLSVSRQRASTV